MSWLVRLREWVHAPADPRTFAALRIGWGLLFLWTFGTMWPDLFWAISDQGVAVDAKDPLELFSTLGLTSPEQVRAVWAALCALAVMVVAGLGGRVTLGLAWLGVVAIGLRSPLITDGSDSVLRVMGFLMLLMPVTRVWSVDQWIRERVLKRPRNTTPISSWALRMFQLQVCVIYVKTGVIKALGSSWHEGTAVYYAMSGPRFWRFHMEHIISMGAFQAFTVVATFATLVFEIGFPLVFHPRLRRIVLWSGVALHGGIYVFMNLGAFSETILWTYLAFVVWRERAGYSVQ